MVSTYLVHHGYCATAEAFARGTGQAFDEEITSIKNRQSKNDFVVCIYFYSRYLDSFEIASNNDNKFVRFRTFQEY